MEVIHPAKLAAAPGRPTIVDGRAALRNYQVTGVESRCESTHWFAVQTKPQREAFAEVNVRALGVLVFLPRLRIDQVSRGKTQVASKPLFTGYFFSRFNPETALDAVRCARGVLRVVSSGKHPVAVHDTVIRDIQARVEKDGCITIQRRALNPGDLVLIEHGPFEGVMGRVDREQDDRKRVAILLETLWNARVLIEERYVTPAAA